MRQKRFDTTPDGKGDWIWKLEDRRVLYRLPELLQYPDATVFVCEGKKDADRVASLGHCATTVFHRHALGTTNIGRFGSDAPGVHGSHFRAGVDSGDGVDGA